MAVAPRTRATCCSAPYAHRDGSNSAALALHHRPLLILSCVRAFPYAWTHDDDTCLFWTGELGQAFVEKSLSGACTRRRTCAMPHELPTLGRDQAFTLCPRPHATRRAAFEALRTSPLVSNADGVVCSHPAALCEVSRRLTSTSPPRHLTSPLLLSYPTLLP